jgi:phenylpropionate dioxygenase-like ring-hydroxylating dioxygenase large terminal subunit
MYAAALRRIAPSAPAETDAHSPPAWIYRDPEFFERERATIFRKSWQPYAAEMAAYRVEELVPFGRSSLRPRAVNWKNVADNFSDGLHINVAPESGLPQPPAPGWSHG